MNPSAKGWINKQTLIFYKDFLNKSLTLSGLYMHLLNCGYIYGVNKEVCLNLVDKADFSAEEICKINHLTALLVVHNSIETSNNFIEDTVAFYKSINAHKPNFFSDVLGKHNTSGTLEKIIHKRIQIDDNIIDKSFNYFITNALLYIDVVAYKNYLQNHVIAEDYIIEKEQAIETIILKTIAAKEEKTKYDNMLINLFVQSLRYQQTNNINYKEALHSINAIEWKQYILDLASMATWTDKEIDDNERYFLFQLGKDLDLEKEAVESAMDAVAKFYITHKKNIALLGSKNIVKSFYNNSNAMVKKLIKRNSKRLLIELSQSKELLILISKSTVKDLTKEEQKKVQEQLLDIFKAIPSLAIFILPGGALLLPLVIKFIPKLLPSAFDDNRIED